MSKKITIPTCMSPFKVTINGEEYTYPSGVEVEVPDEVAHIIECHENALHKPIEEANSGGASSGGGSPEGGGASSGVGLEFNIAYGDTPPKDTSKLWVKTGDPSEVIVAEDKMYENGYKESISDLGTLLPTWLETWASARVGDKIYLFGGETATNTFVDYIYRFVVSTETCEILNVRLPQVMGKIGCAAVGTKIYLIGGGTSGSAYPSVLIFDAETEILTTSGLTYPNTTKCCYIGCASVGTSIYTFGGTTRGGTSPIDLILELKTDTLEWVDRQISLPMATNGMSCATIGAKIYVIGGYGNKNIYCYDTETHTISTLPYALSNENRTMGCCVVGSKIYLFGGYISQRTIICIDTECYR